MADKPEPTNEIPTETELPAELQSPAVHGMPEGGIPLPPERTVVGKFWPKPTHREWLIFLIILLAAGAAVAFAKYFL